MHRSKIEWVDDTWNPVTGCKENCRYCYARKKSCRFSGDIRRNMNNPIYEKDKDLQVLDGPYVSENGGILNYPFGFIPTYHRYRLDYPMQRKNGCNILVGEMGDMFGDWIPDNVLQEIFDSCQKQDIHNYLFLTRFPRRYRELCLKGILPTGKNYWYGSTVAYNNDFFPAIPGAVNTFVCFEPILEEIKMPTNGIRLVDWIIIGAENGNGREKVVPEPSWVEAIVEYADRVGIPVFMKNSLIDVMGQDNMRRELPASLEEKDISPLERARRETKCAICGTHGLKKDMIALAVRSCRGEMPKQLCHICHDCFRGFCNKHTIQMPELEGLKREDTEPLQDNRGGQDILEGC